MTAWIHVGLLQSKNEMIYLPKKVCLNIIHRNTTHLLDMSCCNRHQQQSYHKEITTICMFIHYNIQKPSQLCLNVLPYITKLYNRG